MWVSVCGVCVFDAQQTPIAVVVGVVRCAAWSARFRCQSALVIIRSKQHSLQLQRTQTNSHVNVESAPEAGTTTQEIPLGGTFGGAPRPHGNVVSANFSSRRAHFTHNRVAVFSFGKNFVAELVDVCYHRPIAPAYTSKGVQVFCALSQPMLMCCVCDYSFICGAQFKSSPRPVARRCNSLAFFLIANNVCVFVINACCAATNTISTH